jgi:hypothetical protein
MRAVIVYESMYGNTHHIANAIGDGLASSAEVVVVPVEEANRDLLGSADLLVVGGPTHVHGLSRASTRKAAVEAATKDESLDLDPDAEGPGIREWLEALDRVEINAAAFDTRMHGPAALTGRASKGIARKLDHHGATVVTDPMSFLVTKENHLEPDEEAHARSWGAELGRTISETPVNADGT